jgi:predicted RNase H-like HicB family nuclease
MPGKTYSAVVWQEEALFVAECPEVGTFSQGKDLQDAVANLKEATELYLEEFPQLSKGRPVLTTFEATGA